LFELATRRLPFEADSHISIALKHINEELPRPSQFNPSMAPSLEKLILKATDKSQGDRYQNADEMLKDMKGILIDSNYVVQSSKVSDHTILLTDLETDYIRKNGNKAGRNHAVKNASTYTEKPYLNEEDESEEVSTLYKVLVSAGGVLATLIIIIILSAVLFLWLPGMGKSKDIVMPNLTGKTVEQAENLVVAYKLKINVIGEEPSDAAPVGTIFKQNPKENDIVKPNTVVDVTLAEAPLVVETKIKVPDLYGLDRSKAEALLNEQNLAYEVEGAYDDTIEVGKVMDQIPGAGQSVDKDTKVTVIISKGPKVVLVNVPNLANISVQDAQISLRNVNLELGAKKEETSETVAEGLIMSQSISPNKQVEEGSAVDVVISTGKKVVEVPPSEPVPTTPVDTGLTTKTFTLSGVPSDIEVKDVYHVMIKLTTEDGSKIVFDQQVQKDGFPLNIPISGKGKGTLDTYFDGKTIPSYQDEIDFNEV